jgi:hypothetical protein
LAGWTYDLTGNYDLAFQGFLILLLPAAIAMTWLPKPAFVPEVLAETGAETIADAFDKIVEKVTV